MKNAFIICTSFYDFEKETVTVGGMQTYFLNLVPVLKSEGYEVYITSISSTNTVITLDNYTVLGFRINGNKVKERLAEYVYNKIESENDLVIFGTDTLIPKKTMFKKSIAIQHGIFWDIPANDNRKRSLYRMILSHSLNAHKIIQRLELVNKVVCVDYNFINWYRAQVDLPVSKFSVIPNFTDSIDCIRKNMDCIDIIFARRLCWYRGTKIFCETAKNLLLKYGNLIHITIAGEGPDEKMLHEELVNFNNVSFTRYDSADSLKIHAKHHIAIIPTVGSEGTSLSLLEAMAAKCAVVCTYVGGMSNIVLNGYNGLIVPPADSIALFDAIAKLIDNPSYRDRLAENAYNTVNDSFSRTSWANSWKSVLQSIATN